MRQHDCDPYVPLNGDLTSDPYLDGGGATDADDEQLSQVILENGRWDEAIDFIDNPYYEDDSGPLYQPTLDERHADTTPEELEVLAKEAFHDGYWDYHQKLPKHERVPYLFIYDKEKIVLGVARYLAAHTREKHGLPRPELSLLDRVQAANLHAVGLVGELDMRLGSFLGLITPKLDRLTMRQEEIGSHGLFSGGLIRVAEQRFNFHQLALIKRSIECRIGRVLEVEELRQFVNNSQEEFDFFSDHYYEYDRLEDHPELEAVADSDEAVDPEAVTIGAMRHQEVMDFLASVLPTRELNILIARLGLEGTVPETQEALGARQVRPVTAARIGQIENGAFQKLSEHRTGKSRDEDGSLKLPTD